MLSQSLPTVDIVIPAKNESKHLAECLEALMGQSYTRKLLNVYLIDNGSTDRTLDIARSYPVQVLSQTQGTLAGLRNTGIQAGTGALIGFLDAHCIPEKGWVLSMVEAFLREPLLGACQGAFDFQYENPRVRELNRRYAEERGYGLSDDGMLRDKGNAYPWMMSGNCMVRREALEAVSGFREDLHRCEDVELSWRILFQGYQLSDNPQARVVHYDGNDGWGFYRKYFHYGMGAAQLAAIYALKKAGKSQSSSLTQGLRLLYDAGFMVESLKLKIAQQGASQFNYCNYLPVSQALRPTFQWEPDRFLAISRQVVFWQIHTPAGSISKSSVRTVVATLPPKHQFELQGLSHTVWQALTRQRSRAEVLQKLSKLYPTLVDTLEADVDACILQLVAEGLLISTRPGTEAS